MMEIHPKTVKTTPEPEKKTSQKPYKTKPLGTNQGNREKPGQVKKK